MLIIYTILFTIITSYRLNYGLFLLFLLLPTYLIRFNIGFLPTTLLEIMIWIIFFVWIIKSRKKHNILSIIKQHKSLFIASSIFLLAATISIFTSINLRTAAGEWKAFYIEPFLIFIILITSKKINYKSLIFALVLSGFATSLLSIYQHFTGWMVPWAFWENRNTFRVTGWYGFPNGVGLFLAPIIPLAIYLTITTFKKIKKLKSKNYLEIFILIISILTIPCAILAIFYAKSTGGLIGIISGIGILFLFNKKTRWPAIIIGLLSFLSLLNFSSLSNIKQEVFMQDRSGQIRIDMWGEAIQYLSEHPVSGAGLASYQKLIYPYRIDKWIEVFHHPHNIFLTMWMNLGILGLIGFVWILVWYFRISLFSKKKNLLNLFLISTMTVIVITGLVDSPYIKNDLAVLFWFLVALVVMNYQNKKLPK
jgi:putative inorganic carbon (hco3(-)) transporter